MRLMSKCKGQYYGDTTNMVGKQSAVKANILQQN